MNRPLLLVDVDGVISLFGFDPARPPDGNFQIVDGIAHFLSAEAARHLLELSPRGARAGRRRPTSTSPTPWDCQARGPIWSSRARRSPGADIGSSGRLR